MSTSTSISTHISRSFQIWISIYYIYIYIFHLLYLIVIVCRSISSNWHRKSSSCVARSCVATGPCLPPRATSTMVCKSSAHLAMPVVRWALAAAAGWKTNAGRLRWHLGVVWCWLGRYVGSLLLPWNCPCCCAKDGSRICKANAQYSNAGVIITTTQNTVRKSFLQT